MNLLMAIFYWWSEILVNTNINRTIINVFIVTTDLLSAIDLFLD